MANVINDNEIICGLDMLNVLGRLAEQKDALFCKFKFEINFPWR